MEATPKTSDGSQKRVSTDAQSSTSETLAKPAGGESQHLVLLFLLAVVTTVAVAAGLLLLIGGSGDDAKSVVKEAVISYTPSMSKLGNYTKWAAATDAAPCAGASRYMYTKGGNAIDAAVATLLCHSVALSESTGIGGGFVATIYLADKKKVKTIIAREKAPLAATKDMFVKKETASLRGGLAVAVPGELRGYEALVKEHGLKKDFKEHFDYAIDVAQNGFAVGFFLARALQDQQKYIKDNAEMKKIYFKADSDVPLLQGELLVNTDLADTLKSLKENGVDYFYKGELADKIVKAVNNTKGILTKEDLEQYTVRWVDPVVRKFQDGRTMYSVPPPASGVVLAYMLGIVDLLRKKASDVLEDTLLNYHRFIEALKLAYAKRALLGDTDFEATVAKVAAELSSEKAAKTARSKITDSKTHENVSYYGLVDPKTEKGGTSHTCYWDEKGNIVAITSTVNYYFGSHVIPNGTGFLLNDEMDDFSTPGAVNVFGFSPSPVNFIKPKKIPQSSMAPTILLDKDGNPEMCIGGSGGSRITTGIGLVSMRTLWQGKTIKEAIDGPRVHHQLLPPELEVEASFPKEYVDMLKKKGHKIKVKEIMSNVITGIHKRDGRLYANTDFRKGGTVDGE